MMKLDPMMEALKSRRGKGLELTIMIGPEGAEVKQEMEEKKSDLAPKPKMEVENEADDMDAGDDDMEGALMEGVSDYDKEEMMSGRKPKSLGDRVRMEAMKNKMK